MWAAAEVRNWGVLGRAALPSGRVVRECPTLRRERLVWFWQSATPQRASETGGERNGRFRALRWRKRPFVQP